VYKKVWIHNVNEVINPVYADKFSGNYLGK
jgi:hypothetical protein